MDSFPGKIRLSFLFVQLHHCCPLIRCVCLKLAEGKDIKEKAVLGEMFSRELFNKCSTHECVFKPPGCTLFNYLLSVTEYICTHACLNTLVYSLLCFGQFRTKFCMNIHTGCFSLLRILTKVAQKKVFVVCRRKCGLFAVVRVSSRSWSEESFRSSTDNQERRGGEEEK